MWDFLVKLGVKVGKSVKIRFQWKKNNANFLLKKFQEKKNIIGEICGKRKNLLNSKKNCTKYQNINVVK